MPIVAKIIISIFVFLMYYVTVNLVNRQRLKADYAILWIVVVTLFWILSISDFILKEFAHLIGAVIPISALMFIVTGIIFCILIFYSMKISIIEKKQKKLIQALALLDAEKRDINE